VSYNGSPISFLPRPVEGLIMKNKETTVTTRTNKCETCGKRYKFPQTVFEPRERICFTCEVKENIKEAFESVYSSL